MAEWRKMADAVMTRAKVLMDNAAPGGFSEDIKLAQRKISISASNVAAIANRAPYVDDVAPVGVCPSKILERVVLATVRLVHIHAGNSHVFALCAQNIGLQGNSPRWQSWERTRASVAAHAGKAVRSLRSAILHISVARDIQSAILSKLSHCELWLSWAKTAQLLWQRAADEITVAVDALVAMFSTMSAQFSDAETLLLP